MIKVALTDDHEMVLKGLQQMLAQDPNICLTGIYADGKALLKGLKEQLPDVLLLDLQLPDYSGEQLAELVLSTYPAIKILVLSSIDETKRVKAMIEIGCQGYSLKNVSQATLIAAIDTVSRGAPYMDPVIQQDLMRELMIQQRSNSAKIPVVTRREKEVLVLLEQGCTSKDIAERLFISLRTAENHRKNLLQKFDAKNALSLLKIVKESGLLN